MNNLIFKLANHKITPYFKNLYISILLSIHTFYRSSSEVPSINACSDSACPFHFSNLSNSTPFKPLFYITLSHFITQKSSINTFYQLRHTKNYYIITSNYIYFHVLSMHTRYKLKKYIKKE